MDLNEALSVQWSVGALQTLRGVMRPTPDVLDILDGVIRRLDGLVPTSHRDCAVGILHAGTGTWFEADDDVYLIALDGLSEEEWERLDAEDFDALSATRVTGGKLAQAFGLDTAPTGE